MNLAHVMNVVAVRVTQTGKDTEAGVTTHLAELLTMFIMYVILPNKLSNIISSHGAVGI